MKCLVAFVLLIAIFSVGVQAQQHYKVIVLDTLGGTYGTAQQINRRGVISGDANLTGDKTEHATIWRDGLIMDLGTLGGTNSAAAQVNEHGVILGASETAENDPLAENWASALTCSASGGTCEGHKNLLRAVKWQDGIMIALPTLGGNNANVGFTTALNNKGEAVGWAENSNRDPNCVSPQVLDWEAAIWDANGAIHELPPLTGDSVGAALGINDKEEVVGATSPICAFPAFSLPLHPVVWRNGRPSSLPTLGGEMNNAAVSINNHGDIVGISDLPGDTSTHAVLWHRGEIRDLGTLPGDFFSFAYGINDEEQVIGQSCDINFNCRSALWEKGVVIDVNSLVSSGSFYLTLAQHINDQGVITGQGFDQSTGATPAYVAIPCDGSEDGCVKNSGSAPTNKRAMLPAKVRNGLRRRWASM